MGDWKDPNNDADGKRVKVISILKIPRDKVLMILHKRKQLEWKLPSKENDARNLRKLGIIKLHSGGLYYPTVGKIRKDKE